MLFVDSDNALGSRTGDVDDAYAIAALVHSGISITAISSCAGNTTEEQAFENNRNLAVTMAWPGRLLRAEQARRELADFQGRVLALGPLTNVAGAARASEVIIVGGNSVSPGRWPPLWPYEFNLTKDRRATLEVFRSSTPLTIFPLNVAKQLTVSREEVESLAGTAGAYLAHGTERWFRHLRRARLSTKFPIYDLAAALYAIEDRGFEWRHTTAEMNAATAFRFGRGSRAVKLCVGLDRDLLWSRFQELMSGRA